MRISKTAANVLMYVSGGVVIAFVLLVAFSWWSMESPPVSPQGAARIVPGMCRDAVRDILGEPWDVDIQTDGSGTWTYSHKWKWEFYRVEFSKDGLVARAGEED